MKKSIWFLALLAISNFASAQAYNFRDYVETSDIDNFWIAYDSIKKLAKPAQKKAVFKSVYLDRGSAGLKSFVFEKEMTADNWLWTIETFPAFWNSVRPNTQNLQKDFRKLEKVYRNFQKIYSGFRPATTYYVVGNMTNGGTVINGKAIIGAELAASDRRTDASELTSSYRDRMRLNKGIVFITAHELVHTQQNLHKKRASNLLGMALKEGSADFIAELLTGRKVEAPYMAYGRKNECGLWQQFQSEMYGSDYRKWISNSSNSDGLPSDLGYFIGYAITRQYYRKARNKEEAIAQILRLDFSDRNATNRFLEESGYGCK